ncbi:MAG TPA: DNA-formamidopyrimidine glycosylase family protein [Ilumatobacter sp.]
MPEGLEAELYRRAAERCVGRRVAAVEVDARQAMATEIGSVVPGHRIVGVHRIGKLLVLELGDPSPRSPTLGLHFGMTGRLIVDDHAPIVRLEYASRRDDPAWDRLVLRFDDGGALRVNDPRRWATFTLDPDEERYGPDLLAVDAEVLGGALTGRRAAIKAVLLDQTAVAGLGNLCVDEVLWQAGVSPTARTDRLSARQVAALADAMRVHLPAMLARGGSHRGTLDPEVRAVLPPCPRDGAPLRRDRVAGRTTVWCPTHQHDAQG